VIYLPRGVYILSKPIQLYVGTVLIGDPTSPPTIKAGPGFSGNTLIYGKDPAHDSTINFYIGIKNLVFDSNNINKDTTFTILDWSVSQATQLTNCVFNMPSYSSGHTGITTSEGGSGTYLGDLQINGGAVGINMGNQQYLIKGVDFKYCTTALKFSFCFDCMVQSCTFLDHNVAIDMSGTNNVGSLVVVDSFAQDVATMIQTTNSGNGWGSLILENVQNNGGGSARTVVAGGSTLLSGNVADTWVMGNEVRHCVASKIPTEYFT
jgi:glucan 1,3-beta-glucosidase